MAGVGYVVNNMTLKIGATQYETAVLSVEEVPNVPIQTATMANGDTLTDVGPVQWALTIEANVDVAPSSLWRILSAAAPGGKFKPGEFATFTVTLPIIGQPATS